MEKLFHKINSNAAFSMYQSLIDECISNLRESTNTIYKYYTEIKKIDKSVLVDRNLASSDALAFFFEDEKISFVGKSKTYKKCFLRMVERLCNYSLVYGFDCTGKVTVKIDENLDDLDIKYTGEKLCDRRQKWQAIDNIEMLNQIPLNRLQDTFDEYKNNDALDSQIEFVLRSYLKDIRVSENYLKDLKNWKHQIVVFGKSDYHLFERDFMLLDKEVLKYFEDLMTKRVQKDLRRDDIKVKCFLDEEKQINLSISKRHFKQKKKNM